jgi:glycosyltransferase involved in cell wall biosynthesis
VAQVRILLVSPSFHPAVLDGGVTVGTRALCAALAGQGAEVRVLTTDSEGHGRRGRLAVPTDREVEMCPGVRVRYARRLVAGSVAPALLAALPASVRAADVVLLQAVYSFPTLPVLGACRALGRPLVWSTHGALQRWAGSRRVRAKRAWEAACRLLLPRRSVLHVTSEDEARAAAASFPRARLALIPSGVEIPAEIAPRPEGARAPLALLFVGRLDPKKGIERLLEACALLERDWRLTIVGAGEPSYEAALRTRAAGLGVAQRVTFAGFVADDAKAGAFAAADVVVVPSFTENFAMVVAEALAHAVPVVASTATPWSRLESEGCGLWVPNDPASLAGAIARMAAMPLGQMGARGRRWVARELAWEHIAERMLRLYAELRS